MLFFCHLKRFYVQDDMAFNICANSHDYYFIRITNSLFLFPAFYDRVAW